ncbi:MAG: serine/threonine protein kinase, partial [Gemmataceae bacterium]|nr:serine/threonine protein kinase [Gemmataceae bacterium]
MSDSLLAEHGLLFGVLALQLDFIGPGDLQHAVQAWAADKSRSIPSLLAAGTLAPRRAPLVESLMRELLAQHGDNAPQALSAVCSARSVPLDITALLGPAIRGDMPTLPGNPHTLASPPLPDFGTAVPSAQNRFRLIRPHARGALGEVFVAHDSELNREVALKEMQPPYSQDAGCRSRFLAEAEITGQLEHPGIVPVYGLGVHPDGRPYYAMRFIRGESLHDALVCFHESGERPDSLKMRRLLARFVSVCEAIAYAHSRGVIHRDIKPANIMLGPYGETLVVDWGLAKAAGEALSSHSMELPVCPPGETAATVLGRAVGTPSYMPPEQADGRMDKVGTASDVYALGATLYHLLTGQLPVDGENALEILEKAKRGDIVPPRKHRPDVPPALEAVALKAMALHRADRYAGANELAREVERWLADEPVSAYREPNWEKAARWARRHRPAVAGAAALLVTALLALVLGLWAVGREQAKTR